MKLQLQPTGMFGRLQQKIKLPQVIINVQKYFDEYGNKVLDEHDRSLLDHVNVPQIHDQRQERIAEVLYHAMQNYTPQVYPGRITIFKTRRQPLFCSFDPELCWGQLTAAGTEIKEISGSTPTLLKDPHARVFAKQLQLSLEQAQTTDEDHINSYLFKDN